MTPLRKEPTNECPLQMCQTRLGGFERYIHHLLLSLVKENGFVLKLHVVLKCLPFPGNNDNNKNKLVNFWVQTLFHMHDIIILQPESRKRGAGLGTQGRPSRRQSNETYRDAVRRVMFARYKELEQKRGNNSQHIMYPSALLCVCPWFVCFVFLNQCFFFAAERCFCFMFFK